MKAVWRGVFAFFPFLFSSPLACTPAPVTAPSDPVGPPAAVVQAAAKTAKTGASGCELELAPIPEDARASAPAYLLTRSGLVRVEPGGASVIAPVPRSREVEASVYTTPQYFASPLGKLWMSRDDGLYVLRPTERAFRKVAPALDKRWFRNLIVRSDSDIWALAIEGEVASRRSTAIAHFDGKAWQLTDAVALFGGAANPFDLVGTHDALWVTTDRGLWRGGPAGWTLIDPRAPFRLHASRDRVAGELAGRFQVHDGAWHDQQPSAGERAAQVVVVGASGLAAWNAEPSGEGGLASLQGDGRSCPVLDTGGRNVRFPNGSVIDGRDRVWLPVANGVRVVDANGRVVADYRAGMLDGLTSDVYRVVVPDGGPKTLPAARARRSFEIVGRLQVGPSPLAGASVEVVVEEGVVRRATAAADGSFRLGEVPEGDYRVEVRPRDGEKACPPKTSRTGFDLWTARDCAQVKGARADCDVGSVAQCQQFTPPPMI